MQSWEDVIHTAMIGTDKKILSVSQLPESLAAVQPTLADKSGNDKEALYLQQAYLLMNYKKCGLTLLQKEEISTGVSQPEVKPYFSSLSSQVLKAVSYTHLDVYKRQDFQ